jgi:hypothetical protein
MADERETPPDNRAAVGDALADSLAQHESDGERQVATRDLAHEMILAGAEEEVTPRLLANERPEEFTEADYAAYEETLAEEAPAAAPAPAPGGEPGQG